ncbi:MULTISPECIES: ABC transporter permease [unclassified Microbacterium]|uniref:ABC transporter permease n=1 Tax=unclassified Microbacterium TaxID=2609290 RepID=UPI000EA9DC67|nr:MULTISPECIES: ABC transporter permease [unclassified Microbacterium]MBT2483110.1 ABC transporter permease [Microbacterium sp. ISL-108]RKN66171.1 ABC transporter permease [Microbacterium sp. CGR2]
MSTLTTRTATATVTEPDGSTSPVARAFADTWTITRRDLQHWRHMIGTRVFNWLWPIILMALFLGLIGGALGDDLGGSYIDFVMPGILAMTVFIGLEGTMAAVSNDSLRGITDRFRSLPMSGIAVVGGRCVADLLDSLVTIVVVIAGGLAFGWRPETTVPEALAALCLLLLLRIAMLWTGIYVGLKASSPESLGPINIMVWPILFFSSVFIDTSTMPRWLGVIADANPISATATTVRELLGAPVVGGESWFADNATILAVVWPALIIVIFLPLAVSTYRHLRR